MRLATVIKRLTSEHERAKNDKTVRKPLSYALYQTWRWCDSYEKERNICNNKMEEEDK